MLVMKGVMVAKEIFVMLGIAQTVLCLCAKDFVVDVVIKLYVNSVKVSI